MTLMFPAAFAVGVLAALIGTCYELLYRRSRSTKRRVLILAAVGALVVPVGAPGMAAAQDDPFLPGGGTPFFGSSNPMPLPGQDLSAGVPMIPGTAGSPMTPIPADPYVGTGMMLAANPGAVGQPGTLWAVNDMTLAAVTMTDGGAVYDVMARLPEPMAGDGGFTGLAAIGHVFDASMAAAADPLLVANPGMMALQAVLDAQVRAQARAAALAATNAEMGPPADISETVVVYGFRVHRDVAGQFEAMITASRNAGIALAGGAYRSTESQIALRRAHCGSTDYDIYEKPSKECSPPTARPGMSMHERGKAADFTCNGGGYIGTQDSPCFRWLDANAANYGFFNYPVEPWHWSTNGK